MVPLNEARWIGMMAKPTPSEMGTLGLKVAWEALVGV